MLKDQSIKRGKGVVDLRKNSAAKDDSSFWQKPDAPRAFKKADQASLVKPSPRRFRQAAAPRRRSPFLLFLIFLLVLLAAAAAAGFFIFEKGVNNQSLKLTLKSPKTVVAGEEMILEIGYENLDKVPLEKMELVIEYPQGFYYNSSNFAPYNPDKNLWQLSNLAVGQSGKVEVRGGLFGKVDEEKEFSIVFHYQPENFHSDFRETISKKVKISDTLLAVNVTAPEKIEDGNEAELKVTLKNNQPTELLGLKAAFDLGEAFIPTGLTPTTTNYSWSFDKIEAGQENEIIVKGKIKSEKANPLPWQFRVWQVLEKDGQKEERVWFDQKGQIEVLSPKLEVAVSLANPEAKVNWNEPVDLKIAYKNAGKINTRQAVLKLELNDTIDWSKYQNVTAATRDKNTLIWLSTSGPASGNLAEIPVDKEGELLVTLPLKEEPLDIAELSAAELSFTATASLTVRYNEQDKIFTSEPLAIPLISQVRVSSEARYYLDAATKVGDGPLPPAVNQETKYRIYWKVFSGSKGLTNIKIKSSLPAYINWLGPADQPTAGSEVKFDQGSREIVWEIGEIGPYANLMASFNVSVTPQESQVNQLLILTNPTSLSAEEKETKAILSKTAGLLTSDLVGDPIGQGKGRVVVGQ